MISSRLVTYASLDIQVRVDTGAAAKVYLVPVNDRSALTALNVNARSVARNDLVAFDQDLVLGSRLDHDASTLEVLELAFLDVDFCVDGDKAGSRGIIRGITFKLAVDHLDRSAVEHCNARHFAVSLSEYSTVRMKYDKSN